ncbi:F0F1 ATP synthase subunit delta [Chloroflexota bacterium]
MASSAYSRRYSQALFRIAQESKALNIWQSTLRKLAGIVKDTALSSLLENPEISSDDKDKALSERLGSVDPLVLKLVSMLAAKGRLAVIEDIADEFQRLLDNYHGVEGVEVAEVTTAIELDDEDRLKLAERLTSIIGKPVVLKPQVDPGLIGGIVIRVGDRLIDGSIRSKLDALRKSLSGAEK